MLLVLFILIVNICIINHLLATPSFALTSFNHASRMFKIGVTQSYANNRGRCSLLKHAEVFKSVSFWEMCCEQWWNNTFSVIIILTARARISPVSFFPKCVLFGSCVSRGLFLGISFHLSSWMAVDGCVYFLHYNYLVVVLDVCILLTY